MLNRIFVLIGVLVILAIGGAFVVPRFIQWGDYRERLQTMAESALGTEVAITGDIHLTLLPQPKIEFTKVRVGPVSAPVMEVATVDVEFSLLDFLRDQYKVTGLTLDHPVLNFAIAADGSFNSGLAIAPSDGQSNVSIANATVTGGSLRLIDGRSGATYVADGIDGQVELEALNGPFNFQGTVSVNHAGYGVRLGLGRVDAAGSSPVSLYLKASDESFTLESNGSLLSGPVPKYAGDLTYRHPPPKPKQGEVADAGRGDFVLTGKLEAGAERVLLSDYTALPDENRSATRLTGAAELKLGKDMAFNVIASGGVVSLPPRDATTELSDPPYELVRLLGETPLPPIPNIPGKIGLDIAELNLRAVSLRDLRLDAATDTKSWTIKGFSATLPGNTKLGLSGNLSVVEGRPIFAGAVTVEAQQLDRLAALWRKPPEGNPLFNQQGSLSADVALSSDTLTLSSGTLLVTGINQGFGAEIGFGPQRQLKLDAHFTTLGTAESTLIGALLPDITSGGSFGSTFPKGEINLSASKAVLFGLEGTDLAANATWEGGVLEFSKLAAADLGGASFDAKVTAFGTLAKPELSGSGTLKVEDGALVVTRILKAINTPSSVVEFLTRSLPATVSFQLDAPSGDGGQVLNVTGKLATADTKFEAKLGAGIASALTTPIAAKLHMQSDAALLMTRQLGLGVSPLFGDGTSLQLAATIDGVPSTSYEAHVALEGGDDHLVFAGNVVPGDFTKISGNGQIDAKLSDPMVLLEALGAGGIYLPPVVGKADIEFEGSASLVLSRIDANGASGDLSLVRHDGKASVSGALVVPALDVRTLLPMLAGAASTVSTADSVWPLGPIDIGGAPRASDGRIDVKVAAVTSGGTRLLSDAAFGFDWDAQSVHLRNLRGATGGGTATFSATVCCSNAALPSKQVSGRLSLNGVALDAVAPAAIAANIDGTLSGAAEFNSSGETLGEAIEAMTGSGSYTVAGFSAAHFDPGVFNALSGLSNVLDMTPEALSADATGELAAGPFLAPSLTGSFTIAGGVLRSPNLAIVGVGARIFGGANLTLKNLMLDARYSMSPSGSADAASPIDPMTAAIDAVVKGPLWTPETSYDVSSLVEGIKIKASEVELARLEQLKAESDARAKATADLQARLAKLQLGQTVAAGGAARRLADDAAARQAIADLAAKQAANAAAARNDLGL